MSAPPSRSFDELVDEASSAPIAGWDFTFLQGRTEGQPLPWDYQQVAAGLVAGARWVLDVDTGGGEVFSSLRPPQGSVAVEPHHPNLTIAARRLQPLGVEVVERLTDLLPVADTTFDLVLNRHGYLNAPEVHRVLSPEGRPPFRSRSVLVTMSSNGRPWVFQRLLIRLRRHRSRACATTWAVPGSSPRCAREATIVTRFLDVGAVIFQLRAVSWQAPGFDIARHREQLERIHDQIVRTGGFEVRSQRFLIQAEKPIS